MLIRVWLYPFFAPCLSLSLSSGTEQETARQQGIEGERE